MSDRTEDRSLRKVAERSSDLGYPIVGVGASAGGLAAFSLLLEALPADTGMAWLLVQHLDPQHASMLVEILAARTKLPISQGADGTVPEPDHVYVIPPNATMRLEHGRLTIRPRSEGAGPHMPVDDLFRSLADHQHDQAIGVVLTGNGSDGALGLREIKNQGGITFAQDERSAEFGGMPRSAIQLGCVDFVLPPHEIARKILAIASSPSSRFPVEEDVAGASSRATEADILRVFRIVRMACGIDFVEYKRSSIIRRLRRRMGFRNITDLGEYVRLLQETPAEVAALCQDFLIRVTSFFRDPETYDALVQTVLPRILEGRPPQEPVRLWVPGCATGEEVYSIGICLLEYLESRAIGAQVQIFGTDVNEAALKAARAGVFLETISTSVSADRLQRFFSRVDSHYQIGKAVRSLCIFAAQNVITDPPLSRMDVVSCRNLMIYLDPSAQQRLVPTLHYALNPGGFLVLGSSETLTAFPHLFQRSDQKSWIYTKIAPMERASIGLAEVDRSTWKPEWTAADGGPAPRISVGQELQQAADRLVLTKVAPPGVVVDERMNVLQYRGDTGPYLRQPAGNPSHNLETLARPDLMVDLCTMVRRAVTEGVSVRKEGLTLEEAGRLRRLNVEVAPLVLPSAEIRCFLVLFEEDAMPTKPADGSPGEPGFLRRLVTLRSRRDAPARTGMLSTDASDPDLRERQLTTELEATRAYLQSIVEEHTAAIEELKAANEEILSSNEEFRSTNEELETAKEEIQSSNEELTTLNDELRHRNDALSEMNDDIRNLVAGAEIPLLMVGRDLRIRRLSSSIEKAWSISDADLGRSLPEIATTFDIPQMEEWMRDVIETAATYEKEVQDRDGRWHLLRIRPYLTANGAIAGAVVALLQINDLKRSLARAEAAAGYADAIIETVRDPLVVLDSDLRVKRANRSFYKGFRTHRGETEGRTLFELGGGQWDVPELRRLLEELLLDQSTLHDFEVDHVFPEIGRRVILLNARRFDPPDDSESPMILLGMEDITERERLERELLQRTEQLADADRRKDEFLAMLAHEVRTPVAALAYSLLVVGMSGELNADQKRAISVIDRQVSKVTRIVGDLMDVSRIVQGKMRLDMAVVDLRAVVTGAIDATRFHFDSLDQGFVQRLPEERLPVLADPIRLEQIVTNLLDNASKYTPRGGRIELTVERQESEAVVRVRDMGIGIAPELLPHVFDLFVQAERSMTQSSGGLGLGLTLARRLVEAHGGRIEAESAGPGQGSEFRIILPARSAEEPDFRVDEAPCEAIPQAAPTAGRRVLIVDDDEDSAESLRSIAEAWGHEVRVALDGASAVEQARALPPDAVLLDLGLPGVDGYEVARRLRSTPGLEGLQVIAMTGYGQEQDRDRSLQAGFDHHLVKPVDLALLQILLTGTMSD